MDHTVLPSLFHGSVRAFFFLLISEKKNIKAVAWTCPAALIIIACIFGAIRLGTAKDPDYTFKAAYANGPYRGGFQDEDYDVEYEIMTRYLCDTVSSGSIPMERS